MPPRPRMGVGRREEVAIFVGDVSPVINSVCRSGWRWKLPGRLKVSPQIAGAIKTVAGVVDLHTL